MAKSDQPRKRMAIITTVWRYLSHAQHMGDRFLVGYPWEGKWHRPAIDVVALYVDQKPKDDQSASGLAILASRSIRRLPRRSAAAARNWPSTPY